MAAMAVDPDPANGSRTVLPSSLRASTHLSTNSTGNWQGWAVFSTWFDLTLGMSQTAPSHSSSRNSQKSPGFFPKGLPESCPFFGPLKCRFPGYFDGTLTESKLNV